MSTEIISKKCSKCGEEKPLSEFYNDKNGKYGKMASCKICKDLKAIQYRTQHKDLVRKQKQKYNKDNKDKIQIQQKLYYEQHKDNLIEYSKKYAISHKEEKRLYSKMYAENNKDILYTKRISYRKRNKQKINNWKRVWTQNKIKYDPAFRLELMIRKRICQAMKLQNGTKAYKSMELLGCTIEEARKHLESQFTEGMTWDNHGINGWHIDHIRPCASFDLTDPEQQKQCFNYKNLQPLWAEDNLSKGDKWEDPTKHQQP